MDTGGFDEHDTGSILSRKCDDLYSARVGNGRKIVISDIENCNGTFNLSLIFDMGNETILASSAFGSSRRKLLLLKNHKTFKFKKRAELKHYIHHYFEPSPGNETSGRCYTASRRQLVVLGCGDCPHKPENVTWYWKCDTCNTTDCNVFEPVRAAAGSPEIFSYGMQGLLGLAVLPLLVFFN